MPDTLWGKVRSALIGVYGEAIDTSWFSKLEATENEQTIEQTARAMGVRIRGFEC